MSMVMLVVACHLVKQISLASMLMLWIEYFYGHILTHTHAIHKFMYVMFKQLFKESFQTYTSQKKSKDMCMLLLNI